MPITPNHRLRFGHAVRPRGVDDPSTTSAPTQAASPSPTPYITIPKSTTALIVVISILGLIIVAGIVTWKIKECKRRKREAAAAAANAHLVRTAEKIIPYSPSMSSDAISIDMEKPKKAVLVPPVANPDATWAPQIRTHYGIPVTGANGQPATEKKRYSRSQRLLARIEKTRPPFLSSLKETRTPPPSYVVANGGAEASPQWLHVAPTNSRFASPAPTPPTPPASRSLGSRFSAASEPDVEPLASPARAESYAARDTMIPLDSWRDSGSSDGSDSEKDSQRLPRLMSVSVAFAPTMDDELAVKAGDVVRMIEEYQDGWCLIHHVGRAGAPRGVCPRFCLQERKRIVPTRSLHVTKRNSSTSSGSR